MKRLYYVDALRSFCMLYGVFVHTTTLGDFGLLEWIPRTSDYFRMATFFLVSAFLAGLMIDRMGAASFTRKRALALLLPFAVALLVLNPPTLWLIYAYFDNPPLPPFEAIRAGLPEPNGVAGPAIWHLHLWFLLSLYAYVVLAGPILWLLRTRPVARALAAIATLPGWLVPALLALGAAGGMIVMRIAQEAVAPASSEIFVIRATVLYLPFYALGLALYANPPLWERAHRVDPLLIALSALLMGLGASEILDPAGLPGKAFDMFARAMTISTAMFALLWLFRRIAARKNPVTTLLGASIYTVYLMHFLLIYTLASLLKPLGLEGTALFGVVSLGTIALGLAFHVWGVERSWLLRLLLNGRPPEPRPAQKAA